MKKKVPFNVAHSKAQFSDRVRQALAGEDVIIAKDNKPPLKLVPPKTAGRQGSPVGEGKSACHRISTERHRISRAARSGLHGRER